jgi:signal transduction histidine kinase
MGLRHRSIRLRVAILIVVPVLCLIGLYGFAASITLGSALTQAHAKTIRNDLLTPVDNFQAALAQERHLALLSLASPTSTQFASEVGMQENNTRKALDTLQAAVQSPAVAGNTTTGEQQAIKNLLSAAATLPALRSNVAAGAITTTTALTDYDAIINTGYTVLDEALDAQTSVPIVTQALEVINLARALQATLAESDLLVADMAQQKFPPSDKITFAELATLRQQLVSSATAELLPDYRSFIDSNVSPAVAAALTNAEAGVIATPWHKGPPPTSVIASTATFGPYAKGMSAALTQAGNKLQDQATGQANVVFLELLLAAGLGLLGTIASIALSLIIGRGLVRQLRDLRESALTLAHDKLPSVISQLRAGQQVDASEYEAGEAAGGNEIQQVQHAFNLVQHTAVQTAIDEARLRRGISDVFRNLAGRSQSLLHRQLTLLDGMERRATEPDELEDLFRIDHLTTRMRRHAEGLIILSGEAPARGWRQPVPLVDVLRAAVAEVEDYTRIRVLCRTNAAVSGHAVADVIHLVAELAENATVFSPPNTPVRIQGDVVGRGFAVEIEDRGLGISQTRMDEINVNLANPPQFDLSGSDRLGLFIAGQLAQRHEIKITLRPSVYGGTTAIVLIPTGLVVEEDTYERDPALPAGREDGALPDRVAGRHSALAPPSNRLASSPNGSNGYAITQAGSDGDADFGRPGLPFGTETPASVGSAAGSYAGSAAGMSAGERADVADVPEPEPARLTWSNDTVGTSEPEPVRLGWSSEHARPGVSADAGEQPGEREPVKLSWSEDTAGASEREPVKLSWSEDTAGASEREPVKLSWSDETVGTSEREPVKLSWPEDGSGSQHESGSGWPSAGSGSSRSAGSSNLSNLSNSSNSSSSSGEIDRQVAKSDPSALGLPVRVRQASLAPQLRESPPRPAADTSLGAGFYSGASAGSGRLRPGDSAIDPFAPRRSAPYAAADADSQLASPEAARNTMSALQRGWELGRSEAEQGAGQPPGGYSPSGYPPGETGPHEIPTTSTASTPGSARGPHPADKGGATDPNPADSADQRDNE